jgi:hypothetical protein
VHRGCPKEMFQADVSQKIDRKHAELSWAFLVL